MVNRGRDGVDIPALGRSKDESLIATEPDSSRQNESVIMTTLDRTTLSVLDGKSILVSSELDRHNPAAGVRGTLRVVGDATRACKVEVEVTYPDMFNRAAHDRVLVLTSEQIDQLLTREFRGVYQLSVPYSLREDV